MEVQAGVAGLGVDLLGSVLDREYMKYTKNGQQVGQADLVEQIATAMKMAAMEAAKEGEKIPTMNSLRERVKATLVAKKYADLEARKAEVAELTGQMPPKCREWVEQSKLVKDYLALRAEVDLKAALKAGVAKALNEEHEKVINRGANIGLEFKPLMEQLDPIPTATYERLKGLVSEVDLEITQLQVIAERFGINHDNSYLTTLGAALNAGLRDLRRAAFVLPEDISVGGDVKVSPLRQLECFKLEANAALANGGKASLQPQQVSGFGHLREICIKCLKPAQEKTDELTDDMRALVIPIYEELIDLCGQLLD